MPNRSSQTVSNKARWEAARVGAAYCSMWVDKRKDPPSCRSCVKRKGNRDCHKQPIGARDWKMARAYCFEREAQEVFAECKG